MLRSPLALALAVSLAGCLSYAAEPPTPPEGVVPLGADGKPPNPDFETGPPKDWTAEGDAFLDQPIEGDTVSPRRREMKSQHQGRYWIGGYERKGDRPQGTLTSVPFKVTHLWCSFLVGGGYHDTTCVEIVLKQGDIPIARTSGIGEENLRRVAVDIHGVLGRDIYIRLVDRHTGHWGHINFDDFRFHSSKPDVPPRPGVTEPTKADEFKYAGLPPDKAAQVMTVAEGFT